VNTVWLANTQVMCKVCWAIIAGGVYSLLGDYCRLFVQSVGRIQQVVIQSGGRILEVVSTVCWANTAGCEYSLVGEYPSYVYSLLGYYCML